MKKIILAMALIALSLPATVEIAGAGTIERACLKSDRKEANRSLCGCIQRVADVTLTSRDQRQASKFFKDPNKAQEVRQSNNRSNENFWKRYKAFGESASMFCS